MINKFISFFKKFLFKSTNEEMIPAPCVGDLVEYSDGTRRMVAVVNIENEGQYASYDVRFFKSNHRGVGQKGRSYETILVSDSCEFWPPKDSVIIRDSKIIHPISSLKLSFLHWLNTKL